MSVGWKEIQAENKHDNITVNDEIKLEWDLVSTKHLCDKFFTYSRFEISEC